MAQRAETTVTECFLTSCVWARFLIDSTHYAWTAAKSAHYDFVGSRVYACLSITCHLRFWQNRRGLFSCHCGITGVERTPNKNQQRELILEKKTLPPLLPDSNSYPFYHESGALTNKLSRLQHSASTNILHITSC